jgi:hypothetical protein
VTDVLAPPGEMRCRNETPLAAVTMTIAYFEVSSRLSRIITPAFAQTSVFSMLSTRAMTEPSPVSGL